MFLEYLLLTGEFVALITEHKSHSDPGVDRRRHHYRHRQRHRFPTATTTATTTATITANTTRTTARYWLYSRTCGRPDTPQDSDGCRGLGKGGGRARWGACRPRGDGGGRRGGDGRGIDGGRRLALTGTNAAPGTPGTTKARARVPRRATPVRP